MSNWHPSWSMAVTFWPEPFKRGSDNARANDNCRNDTCKLGHHHILTDDRVQIDCYSILPEQPAFFVFSHHCQPIDRRGHHQEHTYLKAAPMMIFRMWRKRMLVRQIIGENWDCRQQSMEGYIRPGRRRMAAQKIQHFKPNWDEHWLECVCTAISSKFETKSKVYLLWRGDPSLHKALKMP